MELLKRFELNTAKEQKAVRMFLESERARLNRNGEENNLNMVIEMIAQHYAPLAIGLLPKEVGAVKTALENQIVEGKKVVEEHEKKPNVSQAKLQMCKDMLSDAETVVNREFKK